MNAKTAELILVASTSHARNDSFFPVGDNKHWRGADGSQKLVPEIQYFDREEILLDDPDCDTGACQVVNEDGWYHRLNCDGSLDCTQWSGPHDTAWRALRNCLDVYECDRNGDCNWEFNEDADPHSLDPVNDMEG